MLAYVQLCQVNTITCVEPSDFQIKYLATKHANKAILLHSLCLYTGIP